MSETDINTPANSSHEQNKLQCVVKTQEKLKVEDDVYEVKYLIKNLSEVDFHGGIFECHLKIPTLGEFYTVQHKWYNIGVIKAGDPLTLEAKEIRAISGPNIFVFIQFTPRDPIKKFIMVDADGIELTRGKFMHYLRVRSLDEKNSEKNLRIAAYSLIILIGAQLFDWIFQLWVTDIICSQNLIYSGMAISSLIVLIISLIHVRSNYKPKGV